MFYLSKTNIGLVEYAKNQLGKPYWYGCFGQISTETLYQQKKNQYPKYYTAKDYSKQYGQKVHDCIGLIKGYLWSDNSNSTPKYNPQQDVNVDGMLSKCTESGVISTMPNVPGVLVFMKQHVGVYIGNGYVIEAMGHSFGVVKTKLTDRSWVTWGKCPWIDYNEDVKPIVENLVLSFQKAAISDGFKFPKYGADGTYGNETEGVARQCVVKKRLIHKYPNATKLVQRLLGVEQDGKCGPITSNAIKEFQQKNGLEPDACCGPLTWKKLLGVN